MSKAVQSLLRLVENHQAMTNLNPVKDLHVMDLDFVSSWKEMKELEKKMNNYSCVCCPNFKEHVRPLATAWCDVACMSCFGTV